MALGQRNKLVVPEAYKAMEQFKNEIAKEVGIQALQMVTGELLFERLWCRRWSYGKKDD